MIATVPVERQAEAVAALYNAARPVGLGAFHFTPELMTATEAAELIEAERDPRTGNVYFDYVRGRPLKFQIRGTEFDRLDLYDRDQGAGKSERILRELLATG